MEQVFEEIKNSVEQEANQLISRAKRVAEREKLHASEDAEKVLENNRNAALQEAKLRKERAMAKILVEIRKRELEQQQLFIQQLFNMALEKIKLMPRNDKYRAWIKELINAGLENIDNKKAVIFCNEKDADIASEIIGSTNAALCDEYIPISGGIIIKSDDNRLKIDCSAEAELKRAKDELRDDALERLKLDS